MTGSAFMQWTCRGHSSLCQGQWINEYDICYFVQFVDNSLLFELEQTWNEYQKLNMMQHVNKKKGGFDIKEILSCKIALVERFSKLQNNTLFIEIDQCQCIKCC